MKITKNTVLICLFGIILSIIIYIALIVFNCLTVRFESIILNIFTGLMVSLIISLTGYFYKKNRLIKEARDFLEAEIQFIDFYHLKIGKLLEICDCHFDFVKNNIPYFVHMRRYSEETESYLSLITETSEKLNDKDYNGFLKNTKLVLALNEIYSFKKEVNRLRQSSPEIIKIILEIQILLQDIELKIKRQETVDFIYVNVKMEDYNKTLLVRLSKLHEYTASLVIKIERTLNALCKNTNCGLKPKEVSSFITGIKETNRKLNDGTSC